MCIRDRVDSDWAGELSTRKSTSGGAAFWNGMLMSFWSRSQPVISLSSAEAEYYALCHGAILGCFIRSILCLLYTSDAADDM
eukprot:2339561-Alexandrium_andersonii.AAC.1